MNLSRCPLSYGVLGLFTDAPHWYPNRNFGRSPGVVVGFAINQYIHKMRDGAYYPSSITTYEKTSPDWVANTISEKIFSIPKEKIIQDLSAQRQEHEHQILLSTYGGFGIIRLWKSGNVTFERAITSAKFLQKLESRVIIARPNLSCGEFFQYVAMTDAALQALNVFAEKGIDAATRENEDIFYESVKQSSTILSKYVSARVSQVLAILGVYHGVGIYHPCGDFVFFLDEEKEEEFKKTVENKTGISFSFTRVRFDDAGAIVLL